MWTEGLSLLVIVVFVLWTIASLCNQHPRARRLIQRFGNRDVCSLIPVWTFFAPNPGSTDVHLLYRDCDPEGQVTPWREIVLTGRRSWLTLWSPKRRISKGVVDVAPDLTRDTNYQPKAAVSKKKVFSFPYLLLLNYVCCQPVDFRAQMRQFAVVRTNGIGTDNEPEVVFLSAFHQIQNITSGGGNL